VWPEPKHRQPDLARLQLAATPERDVQAVARSVVDKAQDIVGLYLHPADKALVWCVDEKAQIQALDRSQPLLPMRPGQVERRTHDYIRQGTTSLFAAFDTQSGRVIGQRHRRHRAIDFRKFLDTIDAAVPEDLDVHLIVDNYAIHKTALIQRWLAKRPRYHLHLTPKGGSWINLVERWFALLTEKQLRRGVHHSTRELEAAIDRYRHTMLKTLLCRQSPQVAAGPGKPARQTQRGGRSPVGCARHRCCRMQRSRGGIHHPARRSKVPTIPSEPERLLCAFSQKPPFRKDTAM
jgi:transposase